VAYGALRPLLLFLPVSGAINTWMCKQVQVFVSDFQKDRKLLPAPAAVVEE